jgi:hypothetical protein
MTISSAPPPPPPPDDCPECDEPTDANGWDPQLEVCGVCAETHEEEVAEVDAEWAASLDEEADCSEDGGFEDDPEALDSPHLGLTSA